MLSYVITGDPLFISFYLSLILNIGTIKLQSNTIKDFVFSNSYKFQLKELLWNVLHYFDLFVFTVL